MMKPRHCTAVSVSLGGSWHALEEENSRLASSLELAKEEALSAEERCRSAQHEGERACNMEAAMSEELASIKLERESLRNEATSLRASLVECLHNNEAASEKLTLSDEMASSWRTEFTTCRQALQSESDCAVALRAKLASAESLAGQEANALTEMTARHEFVSAELHVAESRLAKRAMHVDLLLRDKERLWSQVARLRKRTGGDCDRAANGGMDDSGVEQICPSKGKNEAQRLKPSRSSSLGSVLCPASPTKVIGSTVAQSTHTQLTPEKKALRKNLPHSPLAVNADVMELQKKAWHLQKALDRERAAHEQTRQKMAQDTEKMSA